MASNGVDTYPVEPRAVLGKKVKRLRRDGVMPANIYGRGVDSLAVQMPARAARDMLGAHGTNTLIEVHVEGEKQPRSVLVRAVKKHPASGVLEHIDFFQVDVTRTLHSAVPIVVVGIAPAVDAFGGVLLHGIESVQVEALPADIPPHLEISVEALAELDQQVTVADLDAPDGVTILSDPEAMLARVSRPRIAVEAEDLLEGEEAPVEAGEEPAEGEEPAKEGTEADEESG